MRLQDVLHLVIAFISLSALPARTYGQITLDGSLGPAGSLIGPNYTISSNLGQTRGGNLFHSFGLFNVLTNQSATFTGPNSVSNIFGRVTGGQPSNIDGQIRSTILNANLYLMNPAGMLFGPNASLDVQGSFHATTADYLKFADGAKFHADLSRQSLLTSAPVSAFGFLSQNPAGITIQESKLQVPDGQTLSVIGGNIDITGGPFGFLAAPAGKIQVASVTSPGEVPIDVAQMNLRDFPQLGQINISNSAYLYASGDGGGTVVIRGGRLLIDSSFVVANNLGSLDGNGPGVDIRLRGEAVVTNNSFITTDGFRAGRGRDLHIEAETLEVSQSLIKSRPFSSGDGGNVTFAVGRLALTDGAQISADSFGLGNGGDVVVDAKNVTVTGGAVISSSPFGPGNGGTLRVTATDSISLDGAGSLITTDSQLGSIGNSGDIVVDAKNVTVTGGAQISSGTFGSGNGGTLTVRSSDTVTVAGTSSDGLPSGLFASAETNLRADAGNLVIEAKNVTVTAGAQIASATFGLGNGGTVRITATDTIILDGADSVITASSQFGITGNAGDTTVEAKNLTVTGGARILNGTFGSGNGGTVTVRASDTVTVAGTSSDGINSGIFAGASRESIGDAGNIVIEAKNVMATGGAQIASAVSGSGNGGTVRVTASDTISLDGAFTDALGTRSSGIAASNQPGSTGNAGDVLVDAKNVTVTGGAQIASAVFGSRNGGTVRVTATDTISLDGSGSLITAGTERLSAGDAGNIVVEAKNVTMTGGAQIASSTFGSGNGGTVRVTADTISLDGVGGFTSAGLRIASGISTSNQPGSIGDAGDLVVQANNVTISNGAEIFSDTFSSGKGGTVRVAAIDKIILTGISPDGEGSAISSRSFGDRSGGSVEVRARQVSLNGGATITATSSGIGNAGNIDIIASDSFRSVNSAVTTQAEIADGGNIHLKVGRLVELINSQITATVKSGFGSGGNITIDPQFVVLNNSQITANAFGGPGGKVTIIADNFIASPDSMVTASSALSTPGTVNIQAPITDLSGSLAPLPESIVQATSLLRQSCATRYSSGKLSSLASSGRGGMPLEPGGFMPSPLYRLETSNKQSSNDATQTAIAALRPSMTQRFSINAGCS